MKENEHIIYFLDLSQLAEILKWCSEVILNGDVLNFQNMDKLEEKINFVLTYLNSYLSKHKTPHVDNLEDLRETLVDAKRLSKRVARFKEMLENIDYRGTISGESFLGIFDIKMVRFSNRAIYLCPTT